MACTGEDVEPKHAVVARSGVEEIPARSTCREEGASGSRETMQSGQRRPEDHFTFYTNFLIVIEITIAAIFDDFDRQKKLLRLSWEPFTAKAAFGFTLIYDLSLP